MGSAVIGYANKIQQQQPHLMNKLLKQYL